MNSKNNFLAGPDSKRYQLEIAAMPIYQLRAIRMGMIRTCVNCINFNHDTEGCGLAAGARPPATVIVLGCDQWCDDIPF